MSDYLDINNEELLKDFFSEAEQQVYTLESNILVIENDPSNHEAIDEIFRAAHTLKGGSATVEMHELSGFTHVMEDMLDALRSGTLAVSEPVVDILLKSLDIIKAMLASRAEGSVYQEDISGIKNKLESMIPAKESKKAAPKKAPAPAAAPTVSVQSAPSAPKPVAAAQPAVVAPSIAGLLTEYEILELKESVPHGTSVFVVRVKFDEANPMNSVGGIQVFASLKQTGQVLKTIPDFDALYEDLFHEEVIYFVASEADEERLRKSAMISDVTLAVTVSPFEQKSPAAAPAPTASVAAPSASAPKAAAAAEPESAGDEAAINDAIAAEATSEAPKKASAAAPVMHGSSNSGSVLRVDSRRIDYLLNLVSETVITKASFNQSAMQFTDLLSEFQQSENGYKEKLRKLLDHIPDYLEQIENGYNIKDLKKELNVEYAGLFDIFSGYEASMKGTVTKFRSASQNLGRITGELQEGVMKIRYGADQPDFQPFSASCTRSFARPQQKNAARHRG